MSKPDDVTSILNAMTSMINSTFAEINSKIVAINSTLIEINSNLSELEPRRGITPGDAIPVVTLLSYYDNNVIRNGDETFQPISLDNLTVNFQLLTSSKNSDTFGNVKDCVWIKRLCNFFLPFLHDHLVTIGHFQLIGFINYLLVERYRWRWKSF
jgi:hypothetical protein